MDQGYVKLWRKSRDSGMLKNHKLWVFWSWCLMKASHKKHIQIVGCQKVELMPGQFVFGRKSTSEELDISEQSIRSIIIFLKNTQNLTIKTTNKFSVITIINWDIYQSDNKKSTSSSTNDQPTTNHKQEWEEWKEVYSDKSILDFSEKFIEWSEKEHGNQAPEQTLSLLKNSCDSVDKLIRLDGNTLERITAVLRWAAKDDFWSTQLRSLAGLRKKNGDGLTKFQNIAAGYNGKDKTPPNKFKKPAGSIDTGLYNELP